jgi:hypothetical protein
VRPAVFALLLGLAPQVARAQVDTARVDSLRADTTDYTALFLRSQQESRRLVPTLPRIGQATLLPAGTRLVFDRDSILWSGAETVSDLLSRVPGVFLLRGGWLGRPELPNYQAHGAASVEYVVDGISFLPLGPDSVMVDPSLFPLSLVDRMEIERSPGQLRVWLFTHRNDRAAPFSRIGVASGDLRIERYQGELEKRSSKGPGLALAFDHLGVPVQGGFGGYTNTQGIIRLSYVRSPRAGVEAQFWQSSPNREAIVDGNDTLSAPRHGRRRDLTARVYFAGPGPGGFHGDLVLSHTQWVDELRADSVLVESPVLDPNGTVTRIDSTWTVTKYHRGLNQAGLRLGARSAAAQVGGSVLVRSDWTPLEVQARGSFAPLRFFSASLEGTWQHHEAERTSRWLTLRGGLALPLGFTASAVWQLGDRVYHPALRADPAQHVDDRSVMLSWRSGLADLEAAFVTNAPFRPAGYAQYPALAFVAPSDRLTRTDWVTLAGRISPRQWFSLSGWFSNPARYSPEGQPPRHAMVAATIQSKFLPTFRSGIFNLKVQVSMERWGAGVLGQSADSVAIALPAVTYYRGYLGLQLGSFMAYYDRYNMQGSQNVAHVPGLRVPGFASTFAVRWEFRN